MKKIIVGMSGGVDSTVAAYLLKKEYSNYEIIGVTMLTNPNSALALKEVDDAKKMCDKIGINHKVVDVSVRFKKIIIDRFVNDYISGLTPAPCSICNGKIKFQMLFDAMKEEGGDYIATGHYAEVNRNACASINANICIRKSKNETKDQSYMLYSLTKEELTHTIFPIGNYDKEKVREIARTLNLEVSDKKDSQDVCFIKQMCKDNGSIYIENESTAKTIDNKISVINNIASDINDNSMGCAYDYAEFIKRYFLGDDYRIKISSGVLTINKMYELCKGFKKGEFVDKNGKVLGYHDGIINYTIGQRKGLNIAFGERMYVIKIDAIKNQVVLGSNEDLFSDKINMLLDHKDTVWQKQEPLKDGESIEAFVKVRYRDTYHPSIIERRGDLILINVQEKIRAITPGQVAVVYDEDGNILFGGIIVL